MLKWHLSHDYILPLFLIFIFSKRLNETTACSCGIHNYLGDIKSNMKKKIICIILYTLLIAVVIPTTTLSIEIESKISSNCQSIDDSYKQKLLDIQKEINEKNAHWIAGYTSVFGPYTEFELCQCGVIDDDRPEDEYTTLESSGLIPSEWDWRNVDGKNWMTSVKSQGGCGSCASFGTLGALEAIVQIEKGITFDCDLSEAFLFFCGGGDCDTGMKLNDASQLISSTGVPDELCFSYKAFDMPCENKAQNWDDRVIKASYGYIAGSSIKEALITYGPVVTSFQVFEDFTAYTGGIYEHVWGDYEAGHAVTIVGYKDDDSMDSKGYWICKNSWGKRWGEEGYFRIQYESCDIGREGFFFHQVTGNMPPISPMFPRPSDTETDVDRSINLSWTPSQEIDSEIVYYTVYLSEGATVHDADKIANKIVTPFITVTGLKYDMIYSWKVIAEDSTGSQSGGVEWKFGTKTPSKPIINGIYEGDIRNEYTYTAVIPDSDSDGHYYYWFFDWGDSTNSGWLGPYDSSFEGRATHRWNEKGEYEFKVRYKVDDMKSDWATHVVSMPTRNSSGEYPFHTTTKEIFFDFITRFPMFRYLLRF